MVLYFSMNLLDTGQKRAIANNFAASTMVLHENRHNKIDETIRIKKQPPDKQENVPHNQKKTNSSKFKRILNLFSKDKTDLMNSAKPPGLFERNIRTTSITCKNNDFKASVGKNYSENYPDKYDLENAKISLQNSPDQQPPNQGSRHQQSTNQHSPKHHSPNRHYNHSQYEVNPHHHRDEKSTMSGYGSSGVGTCDHTVDEDNSSMNNSSIGDKKINEGSSSNGYGSYVSNSSRNASVSSVGNQSEKRSYSYHKPNSKVDERILARTLGGQKERIYHKNSCGTDEYSTADSNSKICTGRMKTY